MSFKRWEKPRPVDFSADRITFLSDAHLGARISGAQFRESALLSFLERLIGRTDRIVFLGDMFDFWIEYDGWIRPEFRPIVKGLEVLSKAGIHLDYVPGNHDFSLETHLTNTCGMAVHDPSIEFTLFGKRFFAAHGDRLLDTKCHHALLRNMLWHPHHLGMYKRLPKTVAIECALILSAMSRNRNTTITQKKSAATMRTIARSLLQSGYDGVVLAHTHEPDSLSWNDKHYCNTGQWIYRYTYVSLNPQGLHLHTFTPDPQAGTDLDMMDARTAQFGCNHRRFLL